MRFIENHKIISNLKNIFVLVCSFIFFMNTSSILAQKKYVIVIDAGHGGKDPGNLGNGYKEKDIALKVALIVGKKLSEEKDVKILYTRSKDVFIDLWKRGDVANQAKADLFISIHCDAFTSSNAYGAGVYVMGMSKLKANMDIAIKENAVIYLEDDYKQNYEGFDPNTPESYIVFSLTQNTYLGQSLQIAEEVEQQFATRANRKSRGVKQAPFYVISRANMPSILIETGFLTNPKEEDYLNSNEGKIYLASAIFRAFRSYKESIERSSEQISKKQDKSQLKLEEKKQLKVEEGVEREELRIEVKSNIVFKVQIGTYLKEMKRSKKFQGLEVEQQNINGTYKYLVGNTTSKKVADKLRIKMVERGFNGAFIIALKDGVRINVKEALSLQNK